MTSKKHNIVIGYTGKLFSEALEFAIENSNEYVVTGRVAFGKKLFDILKIPNTPNILIVELNIPNKGDLSHIILLKQTYPLIKILIISHLSPNGLNSPLIEGGIDAYVLKCCAMQDVMTALSKIVENDNYFCSQITKSILKNVTKEQHEEKVELTTRENQILAMLVGGKSNNQIAEKIGLSCNTVKTHRRNLQSKFGVNNLIGLIRHACRNNLIDFGSDSFCTSCPHCFPSGFLAYAFFSIFSI